MRGSKLWLFLAILTGLLLGHPAWAATNVQFTIVNHSGYPDSQVYIAWLGLPGYDHVNTYHIADWQNPNDPNYIKMIATADNTVPVPPGSTSYYADYSTTLDQLNVNAAGRPYFDMPPCPVNSVPTGVFTSRLWISLGSPLYFQVYSSNSYSQPSPTSASDVNYNTVWDFFEPNTTYNPGPPSTFSVFGDTTNVDYVTMPMVYELYNGTTQVGIAGLNHTRKQLYAALGAIPLLRPLISSLRMLAPGHGQSTDSSQPFYFPSDYFDSYRDYCWTYWTNNTFTFQYDTNTDGSLITWTGQVISGVLNLTGMVNGRTETHTINRPPSQDIFLCNGVFTGVGSGGFLGRDSDLKNQIGSALNRTVFHLTPYPNGYTAYPWQAYAPPTGSGGNVFYQQNGLTTAQYKTNLYSQTLHQQAIGGKIYGFAYDDNANQSASVTGVATEIRLTINKCKLTGTVAPQLFELLMNP